ncbi:MAG: hypothetical protein AAB400_02430, partial [Patescibacteria group bacterium]
IKSQGGSKRTQHETEEFFQMKSQTLNANQIAQIASAVAQVIGGQQPDGKPGRGRRGGKSPRGGRRPGKPQDRKSQTINTLDTIARNVRTMSDDTAHKTITTLIKSVGPKVLEIAKQQDAKLESPNGVSSLNDLSYGQFKNIVPQAMKAAAENQPDVYTEDFIRDVKHILGQVERNSRAFSEMRSSINTEVANGKLNVHLASYFKVTTGKRASLALRGLAAMNEKPAQPTHSFNAVNAQATFQAIIAKSGKDINKLFANHESSLSALSNFAYGSQQLGKSVWSQACAKVDYAVVAQIRVESSVTQMKVRKAS